jgi:hypothetical protein
MQDPNKYLTLTMQLPDLHILEQQFHHAQSNESLKEGYACFTSDSFSGVGAFCFCDNLEEWKDLYPAILFIDALIYKDYETYEEEELEKLKVIYTKYQNSEWMDEDFIAFQLDFSDVLGSYDINFLGKVSQLLEPGTEDCFIERLQKSFGADPKENEEAFWEFLDGYMT